MSCCRTPWRSHKSWPRRKSRHKPSDSLRGMLWRLRAASNRVLKQMYATWSSQCPCTPFLLQVTIYMPSMWTPLRRSLRAWERHSTFSSDMQMLCEALRKPLSYFLPMVPILPILYKLPLESHWEAERRVASALCSSLSATDNVTCSVRLSEALYTVFSLNVNLYVKDMNSCYKPSESLWRHFCIADRMWYALWSHHRAYRRLFAETIILPPILSTPAIKALRGWERRCRRVLWLWKHNLEHMYAL